MTYDEAKILMIEHLEGSLNNEDVARLDAFINANPAFKQEFYNMKNLWKNLGGIEVPEPEPHTRARFNAMLKGYEEGMDATPASYLKKLKIFITDWWADSYVPQAIMGIALLLLGLQIGYNLQKGKNNEKVNGLVSEVQEMKEMMMLTLLEKQSATQRLRAVNMSYELDGLNDNIAEVLFKTLAADENINVRLAAIEAIFQLADEPAVRKRLIKSLLQQDSPIVQAAIIDVIAALQEGKAETTIKTFLQKEDINPIIKEKAHATLTQL